MNDSCLIIAEVGVNHNGDINRALELVSAASEAGADIVKFQAFSADELVTGGAPLAPYQSENAAHGNQKSMLRELELKSDEWARIADACQSNAVEFLATAFDSSNLDMLLTLGLQRVKVSSGEITNFLLLKRVAETRLPIIMSTGMASIQEIETAVKVLKNTDGGCEELTLLHCTSQYPAQAESVNLRAMQTLRDEFGFPVGYSDHTLGWEVAVAAVALGATVLEKHITFDNSAIGPDHSASLSPTAFREMVQAVRLVELAMGDGQKVPHESELSVRQNARRSIVAARPIIAGQVIQAADITLKRPGTGLSPMTWHSVIGSLATKSYQPDDLIEL